MLLAAVSCTNDMDETKPRTTQMTKYNLKFIKHQLNIQINSNLPCAKEVNFAGFLATRWQLYYSFNYYINIYCYKPHH